MKIAQINSVCGILSTGRIALDLSLESNMEGIDNKVFYGFLQDPNKIGKKFNKDIFVHLDAIFTRLFGHRGNYSYIATTVLIRRLNEYKPDIVHLHNIHGQYLNVPLLMNYLKNVGIPVVWTFHDCWPFTGDCFYFDKVQCNAWKYGCNKKCAHSKELIVSKILNSAKVNWEQKKNLFLKIPNLQIVTPSNWLKSLVEQSFFQNIPVSVIYNGIDLSKFKNVTEYKKNSIFTIMGICFTLDETDRKGGFYLVKLAKKLGKQIKVILVGMDNRPNGLPDNVICVPKTNSQEELARYYSEADVFVNPTLEDNFPTVNIEALACGTPVITFRTGGSPEAIDSSTGAVVEQGDYCGLEKAVLEIMKKGKKSYSKNCTIRANKLFSREAMSQNYIRLYRKILGEEE